MLRKNMFDETYMYKLYKYIENHITLIQAKSF